MGQSANQASNGLLQNKPNVSGSQHHMNIPLSPTNSKPISKQKLRVVSPISRGNEELDGQSLKIKTLDGRSAANGNYMTLNQQHLRLQESPDSVKDIVQQKGGQPFQNSIFQTNPRTQQSNSLQKLQQYQQQLQVQQNSQIHSQQTQFVFPNQNRSAMMLSEYEQQVQHANSKAQEQFSGNKTQNAKMLNDEYQISKVITKQQSPSGQETQNFYEESSQNTNRYSSSIFHEKAKSLTSNQIQQQLSQNENSANKKQNLLHQQQQLILLQLQMQQQAQVQLSPGKLNALLQMGMFSKGSLGTLPPQDFQIDSTNQGSPESCSVNQQMLKTRRKKSQGKINVNLNNLNAEDILKHIPAQSNVRSSSQPQARSQSQQANSQERPVLQLKKASIRAPTATDSSSNLVQVQQIQFQQQFLLKQQESLRVAQLEGSVERTGPSQTQNKQGNLKILLKKTNSVKQMVGGQQQSQQQVQQTVKISKDQILLKNQQNYNSQGSSNSNQPTLQIQTRSRSLSNSKFAKKKTSPGQTDVEKFQQQQEDVLIQTQRNSNKERNIIGNSFNQNVNIAGKQRCKSSTKASVNNGSSQEELLQSTQGQQVPMQNSSKVLMFKTNNEESNAKVAALKSLIKLSSSNNTNYMQPKQVPIRNQSKENISNQTQNQIQPNIQLKQMVQKLKGQETTNQGQFVQKCASAQQKNLNQQTQQYMQRITSNRVMNQPSLNYHSQIKSAGVKEISHNDQVKLNQGSTVNQQQIKINITQNTSSNLASQDNRDNSSSLKLGSGQVSIRNFKVNSSQQNQQKQVLANDNENIASLALMTTNKAQVALQQKMHQILIKQQTQQPPSSIQGQVTQLTSKSIVSRNVFNAAQTLEESSNSLKQKRQSAGVDLIPRSIMIQNNGNSNESFKIQESNQKSMQNQFSRKNSTMSNGSIQSQVLQNQRDMKMAGYGSDVYSALNQDKDKFSRLQNTSQMTYQTQGADSTQRKQKLSNRESDKQTTFIFSENINSDMNFNQSQKKLSNEKCSGGKKLNFYNQISPTSDASDFRDSQLISAFKSQNDSHMVNQEESQCCLEDESIVIIQEDQLRIPLRSSKNSQKNSDSQKFVFDSNIIQTQEVIEIPASLVQIQNPLNQRPLTKEEMVLQSMESDRSVFKKKHDNSVIEQESLVNQIKTQLMKIHFQQAFQGDNQKSKRLRNQTSKDCQTMKNGDVSGRLKMDLDTSSKQTIQQSGTFYFEPQFDDISFEIDTCNQIRVPKNMMNPIVKAKILSLPEELEIYQERQDPVTGKVKFTIDKETVTLLAPKTKKNYLKAEYQILKKSVLDFPDPLKDKLKRDYENDSEEKKDEDSIEKELQDTMNFPCSQQLPIVAQEESLSFRHSVCSSNNYSLNTFLSEDVSLNSNIFSQLMNSSQNSQLTAGILTYTADKLNVREGDPLFLLPRLNEKHCLKLKLALLKREPEWWMSQDMPIFGRQRDQELFPRLEQFYF